MDNDDGMEDELNSEFVQLLHNSVVFVVCGKRVCVCACVRERERKREREGARARARARGITFFFFKRTQK
jgi:hypothetical protein